jgi:hypothetical protein
MHYPLNLHVVCNLDFFIRLADKEEFRSNIGVHEKNDFIVPFHMLRKAYLSRTMQ